MKTASDTELRIAADRARGDHARATTHFFNKEAWTASLRATYELGREHERLSAVPKEKP